MLIWQTRANICNTVGLGIFDLLDQKTFDKYKVIADEIFQSNI